MSQDRLSYSALIERDHDIINYIGDREKATMKDLAIVHAYEILFFSSMMAGQPLIVSFGR